MSKSTVAAFCVRQSLYTVDLYKISSHIGFYYHLRDAITGMNGMGKGLRFVKITFISPR